MWRSIHAQKADRAGNVLVAGIIGVQKEAVLAAQRAIATVEEIVDDLGTTGTNAIVLPSWTLSAVAVAPGGARPSYAHGYYARDNAFYTAWDAIARDRERFPHGSTPTSGTGRSAGMTYSASEMMTVAAARALTNDDICFVGIGLPSAACNLARLTHAPRLTLVYESGTLETKPQRAAALHRRRRAV